MEKLKRQRLISEWDNGIIVLIPAALHELNPNALIGDVNLTNCVRSGAGIVLALPRESLCMNRCLPLRINWIGFPKTQREICVATVTYRGELYAGIRREVLLPKRRNLPALKYKKRNGLRVPM